MSESARQSPLSKEGLVNKLKSVKEWVSGKVTGRRRVEVAPAINLMPRPLEKQEGLLMLLDRIEAHSPFGSRSVPMEGKNMAEAFRQIYPDIISYINQSTGNRGINPGEVRGFYEGNIDDVYRVLGLLSSELGLKIPRGVARQTTTEGVKQHQCEMLQYVLSRLRNEKPDATSNIRNINSNNRKPRPASEEKTS